MLTRDGRMNSDASRKVKQIKHLTQFLVPAVEEYKKTQKFLRMLDLGSGKSYFGFYIYETLLKEVHNSEIISIESREDLSSKSQLLAQKLGFERMSFKACTIQQAMKEVPQAVDVVVALHACDTATDEAISFGVGKNSKWIVFVPCCQAELSRTMDTSEVRVKHLRQLFRHPHHKREFMSHLTNVFRGLFLESQGYKVRVSELVGWEHSLKNEIWIAERHQQSNPQARAELERLREEFGVFPSLLGAKF